MSSKTIGGIVAALGIIGALIGVLFLRSHHKLFPVSVALGVIFLIVGVVLYVMPARTVGAS